MQHFCCRLTEIRLVVSSEPCRLEKSIIFNRRCIKFSNVISNTNWRICRTPSFTDFDNESNFFFSFNFYRWILVTWMLWSVIRGVIHYWQKVIRCFEMENVNYINNELLYLCVNIFRRLILCCRKRLTIEFIHTYYVFELEIRAFWVDVPNIGLIQLVVCVSNQDEFNHKISPWK